MKHYDEWLKKDTQGGIIPENKKKAKEFDLITLPKNFSGTNCGNCKFFNKKEQFCDHKDIKMHVNDRQCCIAWDAQGTYRSWLK